MAATRRPRPRAGAVAPARWTRGRPTVRGRARPASTPADTPTVAAPGPGGRCVLFAHRAMESHTLPTETPAVPLEVLETFVELLSRVEADGSSDAFYSRLCEATC